jgi:hypothetical protein
MPTSSSQFSTAFAKIWIASIDRPELEVRAQYNPRELQIEKQITWKDPKKRDNQQGARRHDSSIQDDLEFNGGTKRSMQVELLFDGYEQGASIEPDVQVLEVLSTVRNPESSNEDERRPHHCLVGWGAGEDAMRPFCCVIESLTTKYTMWSSHGTPLRATCTVRLKEAQRLSRSRIPDLRYDLKKRPRSWLIRDSGGPPTSTWTAGDVA